MTGTEPAWLVPLLIGGGAAAAAGSMSKPKTSTPSIPQAPAPPSASQAVDKATDITRRKKASLTKSIYTSPLGVTGEANIVKKTLLGQ